jgi:uncharacterized protein (TIGR02246 family)
MSLPMRVLLVAIVLGMAGACSPAGPGSPPAAVAASDEAAIRAAADSWTVAYNAREVDKVVALYTDDAVLMPPNVQALPGRAAITKYLTQDIAASKAAGLTFKDGPSTVGVSGDLAWHTGTSSAVDASGKVMGTVNYTEVWRRTNGKWLMVRDIWNDDAPPAPAPAN